MSIPVSDQQPWPPPAVTLVSQKSFTSGSIGALIAVLAMILILGIIAGVIGRLCSGRRTIMGHGPYDLESWAETTFSSCIDGRINPPQLRPTTNPIDTAAASSSSA
ncbi:hypothetical protein RJ641_029087 [Dillenia turbinata]|uniref:Uncharacterized protein n=1 Tax=Dillenia turbinata TaxID=194707 RepID=A0AAN8ZIV4_9MAGN